MKYSRILLLMIALLATTISSMTQDIVFNSRNTKIAGTVIIPEGIGPFPAMVVVHGSGKESRENYIDVAQLLKDHQIASIIYDKRGVGQSEGREDDWYYFNIDLLAADVVAAVKYLTKQEQVDASKIGLITFSQGGWIGTRAAEMSGDISLVVHLSVSVCSVAEDRLHDRRARLLREGFSEDEVAEASAMQRVDQQYNVDRKDFALFQELWEKNKNKSWFRRVYISDVLNNPNHKYRIWKEKY